MVSCKGVEQGDIKICADNPYPLSMVVSCRSCHFCLKERQKRTPKKELVNRTGKKKRQKIIEERQKEERQISKSCQKNANPER